MAVVLQDIHPDADRIISEFIDLALREDIGEGDHTSKACISADARSNAHLLVKDVGVIAGIQLAEKILKTVDPDCTFVPLLKDGDAIRYGDVAFDLECNTQALLRAERVCLNMMQRMSGIASLSNRYLFEVEDLPVKILDTRKTTPGIRFFEKWAVNLGGCFNYRFGLYDWIMVKDNHIDACGGIPQAIERVHAYLKDQNLERNITIEVRNLVELHQVLEVGGVTRIMLDNFEIPILREAVATIDNRFETEASGGINIHTVRKYAQTGVDFISIGALTHSATSLDLSLKIVK
ncbi:MAG: carboxylating nicotinate-nucleotide diphosphorylase [Saprospiraceae bacterium]|nr:carboxylating nicotinate-nucleotide diphosphorylase [Saprospiraceae bacterium]